MYLGEARAPFYRSHIEADVHVAEGVPHLRRSGICSMLRTQRSRAGLTCVAPPALGKRPRDLRTFG
jgi:hypothetical protein